MIFQKKWYVIFLKIDTSNNVPEILGCICIGLYWLYIGFYI